MQKYEWMLAESEQDDMNLSIDDLYFILVGEGNYDDATIDYVFELEKEWRAD